MNDLCNWNLLTAHLTGSQEVSGSNPLSSTYQTGCNFLSKQGIAAFLFFTLSYPILPYISLSTVDKIDLFLLDGILFLKMVITILRT